MATAAQVQSFIDKLSKLTVAEYQKRKAAGQKWILPSVCIAQSALETGWGTSKIMIKANAYFGIKAGTSWKGKVYSTKTQECYDGVNYTTITDLFRAYSSLEESVADYFDLLTTQGRYAFACNQTDARTCISAIKDGGYATNPAYVTNVMSIINQYNLTQYDTAKEESAVSSLWIRTAELMAAESGYCEKKSNSNLDSKTGNAGFNNYTKYARDVNSWGQPGCQAQPWCAVYQFWICVKIFGLSKALQIMGGGFYNCNSVKAHAKSNGTWHTTPKLGALIIFRNGAHIGRVTKITSSQVYTNEGNTSKTGQNNVVANGGMVCDKVYTRDYSGIDGYVWIDYGTAADSSSTTLAEKLSTTPKWVGKVTAAELNVRSWAGREYPNIKKWPLLKKDNLVDVCDSIKSVDGSKWYYIRIAGKYYGFVHSGYIKRQ